MTATIVGVRRVDMDSENVHGFSLYINYKDESVSGIDGMMAERQFVNDTMIRSASPGWVPTPGDTFDFEWGRREGKIGRITTVL